ncbi:hypothetical protein Godav_028105 [Gossypium davidsonii]|uniref:Cell division cycle 5-like protein n=1 Tax=Gossypium davidsonii TaxID=34287 RepID=A0A7J8RY70_GOSDV|nr:hypothetical protein [Gossypium davidsonii]
MRIMIKGGVWKNTEDEILKAAVMKYGKNQWARISSLLVRKSAKQCKARWYEWLDPSIKKTEWTREEDEKLLHLAKLMPTQWRTIAPIVGRTPSQCLERYEKLLDAACARDENYEPGDDPRKLRPGEIDPNPESKPARPDPVDMDEDEKEMLSEARARLANTRGKKAKRKAREKQLEEARRLASLQKRRELKAAGIDTRQRKRKGKGIDYNAEIPFEKRPPPGFYDVADEDRPVEQPKFPTTIEELEGKRRVDIEAQLRKQDIAKNKISQRQDAASAILQANKLNDPEAVRKRSKLMLPEPQISNHELEEIAKMGYASDLLAGSEELAEGSTDIRRNLRSGLGSLPQPKNEYQIVVQPPPEESEEPEEKIEEDMSDRIARERAEEEARQQALLKKRSKVLQRELPRPPSASLELIRDSLMRTDGDKSTFVPPTLIEQADEMIRKELLSLLEHDNAKYPLDEKAKKGKKKGAKRSANGSIPSIEDFEEDEMKEADSWVKEEAEFLRVAMGHENESLDDFVEAHNTCLNDLMYFPTRHAYGLSSVAGNTEKLAALQTEFDHVKKKMDNDKLKAEGMEKKFNVLTQGYERRAATLWRQIESTFKQIDTAGTELECFQALQKQEQLAASHRINGLWEEVQKQKELEQTLQSRYGNLIAEIERIQKLMNVYRAQAQKQEEAAEKDHALESSMAPASQATVPSSGLSEPAPSSEDVYSSLDGQPSLKIDMNVDSREQHATMDSETGGNMSGNVPLVVEDNGDNITKTPAQDAGTSSEVATESVNPDTVSTKPESIEETLEGEGFTDHAKIDSICVLGGDTAENQTAMEE